MKQKYLFSFGMLICGTLGVCAQSSIVASGGDYSVAQGATVAVTVGQPAVETFSESSGSVLLGIQQDFSDVEFAIATKPIPNITVELGQSKDINLTDYFVSNGMLAYSATSSDNDIVKPIVNGTMLSFELSEIGTARIIVVAVASDGQRFPASFTVTVEESEPVTDATKEHLIILYGNACTLLNMEYDRKNKNINLEHQILFDLTEQAKDVLLSTSATNKEVEFLNSQLEQSMSNYIRLLQPTAIYDVVTDVKIMVKGHTVCISNIQGKHVAILDITGKKIYSCHNAESIEAIVNVAGTYIVMVGEVRKTIVIK